MLIPTEIESFIQENLQEHPERVVFKIRAQLAEQRDFILDQINGRKKAPHKLPSWSKVVGLIYPSVLSFEQCSSENTAQFKATLVNGVSLIDMTGGFGVDTYFLAQQFAQVDYFEQQELLVEIVKSNFALLGMDHVQFHATDSIPFLRKLNQKVDWIYVDPARRNETKGKVFLIEDCEPDLITHLDFLLSKTNNLMIKFSPMLDLEEIVRKLKGVKKIWVVAVKNECKEVLIHLDGKERALESISIESVNLLSDTSEKFSSDFKHRKTVVPQITAPAQYLYEPNKAILKSGTQDHLSQELGLSKLEQNSNFFTSDEHHSSFPGRIFLVKDIVKAKAKQLRKYLPEGKANIIARNYPLNAAQIYTKFKITPGGDVYLLATRLANQDNSILVCERLK